MRGRFELKKLMKIRHESGSMIQAIFNDVINDFGDVVESLANETRLRVLLQSDMGIPVAVTTKLLPLCLGTKGKVLS